MRHPILALACAGVLLATALPAAAAPAATTPARQSVPGSLPPALAGARLVGPAAATGRMDVAVGLRLRDEPGLDALLARLYDPAAPEYLRFLTPEQFSERFGPTAAAYAAVVAHLRAAGLAITYTAPNRLVIGAEGPVAAVEQAFAVQINRYARDGKAFSSADREPSLPASLAPLVQGIIGLSELAVQPHLVAAANPGAAPQPGAAPNPGVAPAANSGAAPQAAACAASGYGPGDIARAYNITGARAAGLNGRGQTIAIATAFNFRTSEAEHFWSCYGLPLPSTFGGTGGMLHRVAVGGSTRRLDAETTLDVEWSYATAPQADFLVYEAHDALLTTFTSMYNQIVTDNKAAQVSTSWGLCEANMPGSTLQTDHNIFKQAAAQGQAWFAAAGDSGSADCGAGGPSAVADFPAADPYVTATGGTHLACVTCKETAWSGSGGAPSQVFAKPAWQSGSGTVADGRRDVSDVALDADPNTGYATYYKGAWGVYGGTSFAAPQWVSLWALANQQKGSRLGQANPHLYAAAGVSGAYRDVTSGSNGAYSAGNGWDFPTGWGTPDAYRLVQAVQTH